MTRNRLRRNTGLTSTQAALIAAIVVIIILAALVGVLATRKPVSVSTTPRTPTTPTPVTSVTFYTWWATEGKIALNHEIPAIQSMTGLTLSPEIVPGAGGTNAKYAILALVEAGKPPAAFQVHYGPEMISYVEAAPNGIHSFVNMTGYATQWGLMSNAVPAVLQAGAFNGTLLSIPVNVHRGALIWVNNKVLREYNLPFPSNFSLLVSDTLQLAKDGVTPWMVPGADGGWDQLNLWEDIFLSLAGPKLYNEIIYGVLPLSNTTVERLIQETNYWFLNFTSYSYPGELSLSWTQGLTDLIQGKVVFQANGNWLTNYAYDFDNTTAYPPLAQYLDNSSITLIETPFPGTQGYYALVIDSVGIPVGPQQQQALEIAHAWSSYQGQAVWTKWKAVTYYKNATDYYNTPAQWYDYQQLLSTSEGNFVYQLSDGGLFDDVFATLNSGLLTLQEVGVNGLSAWNSTLASALHQEEQEWLSAAKIGLGYLGFPGHPFAGYYPPWVGNPSAYGLTSYSQPSRSVSTYAILAGTVIVVPECFKKSL
jgi:glucose/arabinose transport system substrate-binding protein